MGEFLQTLAGLMGSVFVAIWSFLVKPLEPLLAAIQDAFPQYAPEFEALRYWLEVVCPWCDLNRLFSFFLVWVGWMTALAGYRFAKSWLPFLSGS
jgi:hypothetical protein